MTRIHERINGWLDRLAWAFAIAAVFQSASSRGSRRRSAVGDTMRTIATSLTGPVAYAIGLIGIAIAGGTMLWGGSLRSLAAALA